MTNETKTTMAPVISYINTLQLFFRAVQALPNWIQSQKNITIQNLLMEEAREASYYVEDNAGAYSRKLLFALNSISNPIDTYDLTSSIVSFRAMLNTINWHVIRAQAAITAYRRLDTTLSSSDHRIGRLAHWAHLHQKFAEESSIENLNALKDFDDDFKVLMAKPATDVRFNIIPE